MHCFGGVPLVNEIQQQLVCQASNGDIIYISCPRYILSLIVNKINYSKVINITWSQTILIHDSLLIKYHPYHGEVFGMVSYCLSTKLQASGMKVNCTHFSYFIISDNHTLCLIRTTIPSGLFQSIKQIGTQAQLWNG